MWTTQHTGERRENCFLSAINWKHFSRNTYLKRRLYRNFTKFLLKGTASWKITPFFLLQICPTLCCITHEYACPRPERSSVIPEKLANDRDGRTTQRSFLPTRIFLIFKIYPKQRKYMNMHDLTMIYLPFFWEISKKPERPERRSTVSSAPRSFRSNFFEILHENDVRYGSFLEGTLELLEVLWKYFFLLYA